LSSGAGGPRPASSQVDRRPPARSRCSRLSNSSPVARTESHFFEGEFRTPREARGIDKEREGRTRRAVLLVEFSDECLKVLVPHGLHAYLVEGISSPRELRRSISRARPRHFSTGLVGKEHLVNLIQKSWAYGMASDELTVDEPSQSECRFGIDSSREDSRLLRPVKQSILRFNTSLNAFFFLLQI
jgi:hypothetical protein